MTNLALLLDEPELTIQAIPTIYREQLFRSQLEARFARWLDGHGVVAEYEKERLSNGYLSDFYVMRQRLMFEVKGSIQRVPPETKALIANTAVIGDPNGWAVMTVCRTWQLVRPQPKFAQNDPHKSPALLCAGCGEWAWRNACPDCGSGTGYLAEHVGPADVRVPQSSMEFIPCPLWERDRGYELEPADEEDLRTVALPEHFDPGEHERVEVLLDASPQPCPGVAA